MNFEEKLERYADLLVTYGLNVQHGQTVNVACELFHREFAQKIVKAAYRRGAKYVNVDFLDPILAKTRIQESQNSTYLEYVPHYIPKKFEGFIDDNTAVLRLTGSEYPGLLGELPAEKVNAVQSHYMKSLHKYYSEGVGKMKVQWTVAAAATPAWGKKIFPELDEEQAYMALWEAIFQICRIDRKNYLEAWEKHDEILHKRAKHLTDLKIKELHFTGPETDLKVYLSPKAIFTGGSKKSAQGVRYEANIPTEECFTTPDYRLTEGKVRVTRPVPVNGKLVHGLKLQFKNGEITHFTATEGQEQFGAYISADPGAKRLGEVALVGVDSPIYQSKRIFEEILYDENAACHIAIGFAYRLCIDGGTTMNPQELEAVGCNTSSVHTDFMISTEEVDVTATLYNGQRLPLIKQGKWV